MHVLTRPPLTLPDCLQQTILMIHLLFAPCNEVLSLKTLLPLGGYNPDEYEDLPVSPEVQDLFQYIMQYKPEVLQLETPLKPFIPEFVPAVGDIDEFIKVNADALATGQQHPGRQVAKLHS